MDRPDWNGADWNITYESLASEYGLSGQGVQPYGPHASGLALPNHDYILSEAAEGANFADAVHDDVGFSFDREDDHELHFPEAAFDLAPDPHAQHAASSEPERWLEPTMESTMSVSAPPPRGDSLRIPQRGVEHRAVRPSPTRQLAAPKTSNGIQLRPVTLLPDRYRLLFRFGLFNAVQSACFDTAVTTDDNMVVCAPTGSGKTVIFELAMIRMLCSGNADDQAVYICPSKALVAERVRDWTERFGKLGISVAELTGDTDVQDIKTAKSAKILVTTADKWDATTRRPKQQQRLQSRVRLLMIDEVHLLNENRGPRLEAVIARVKTQGSTVRMLALSATVPNVEDVAEWIGLNSAEVASARAHASFAQSVPAKTFEFNDEFRPVPLKRYVYGYKEASLSGWNNALDKYLMGLIKDHGKRKPVLVFVPTRAAAVKSAKHLAKEYAQQRHGPTSLPWAAPTGSIPPFEDAELHELAKHGVAFHHAGVSSRDKSAIVRMFLDGRLSVICCTSTLAVGTNLPAHLVIIRGTQVYDQTWKEISGLDLIQMLGRAGRPDFDTEGCAVIMCDAKLKSRYENVARGEIPLESQLGKELKEHFNSQIALQGSCKNKDLLRWLRGTFYHVRLQKNPSHYIESTEGTTLDPAAKLKQICSETIESLVEHGLVTLSEDGLQVDSSPHGDIMAKHFVNYGTMIDLMKPCENDKPIGVKEVLEKIASAQEFKDCRMRKGEGSFYTALGSHNDIRFPIKKPSTTAHKVSLLIQAKLAGIPFSDVATSLSTTDPVLETNTIFRSAPRLSMAILDLALHCKDGHFIAAAFEVMRAIAGGAWDASPALLQLVKGVGEKYMRLLSAAGITTIEDVANESPRRLEQLLRRRAPFGNELVATAKKFPLLKLDVQQTKKRTVEGGVSIKVNIEVALVRSDGIISKHPNGSAMIGVAVLVMTSDRRFIDFRRGAIKHLRNAPQSYTVDCLVTKPSQKIVCIAACDCIPGTVLKAELRPDIPADEYPPPASDPFQAVSAFEGDEYDVSLEKSASTPQDSGFAGDSSDQPMVSRALSSKRKCKKSCGQPCCKQSKKVVAKRGPDQNGAKPKPGSRTAVEGKKSKKATASKSKPAETIVKPSTGFLSDDTSEDDLAPARCRTGLRAKRAASDSDGEFDDPFMDEILAAVDVPKSAANPGAQVALKSDARPRGRKTVSLADLMHVSRRPDDPQTARQPSGEVQTTASFIDSLRSDPILPSSNPQSQNAQSQHSDPAHEKPPLFRGQKADEDEDEIEIEPAPAAAPDSTTADAHTQVSEANGDPVDFFASNDSDINARKDAESHEQIDGWNDESVSVRDCGSVPQPELLNSPTASIDDVHEQPVQAERREALRAESIAAPSAAAVQHDQAKQEAREQSDLDLNAEMEDAPLLDQLDAWLQSEEATALAAGLVQP